MQLRNKIEEQKGEGSGKTLESGHLTNLNEMLLIHIRQSSLSIMNHL